MTTPNPYEKYKWWVLAVSTSALAMIFCDQSALPVALPTIQQELNTSSIFIQWVMNAYLLTIATFITLGGKLGDRFGHRRIFLMGMIIFIISSLLCAIAPTAIWLIIGRVLQGAGAALMAPASAPLLRSVLTHDIGKMMGIYVSIASLFMMLGPTLGGFLTQYLNWRWIFWINFPLAFIGILIIIFRVPKIPVIMQKGPFDKLGFALLAVCLVTLVFGLMQAAKLGWTAPLILGCFAISLICLVIFIQVEKHHNNPFIHLELFKNTTYRHSLIIISFLQIVYISIIFWAIFLQYVLAASPYKTGIMLLAAQLPVLFSSHLAGRMLDRMGPRIPTTWGTLFVGISILWIAIFSWKADFSWLLPAFILFGISAPMVTVTLMSTIMNIVEPDKRGTASGIMSAARQISGSIGLAIIAAIIMGFSHHSMKAGLEKAQGPLHQQLGLNQLDALMAGVPLPPQLSLNAQEITQAHHIAIHAYTVGFSIAMSLVAVAAFLAFLVSRKLPNVKTHV